MMAAGTLLRVARGLYALPDYQGGEHGALVTVAKRAPGVLFCLLTALRFHDLTTQAPFEVWIAIGNKDHPPRLDYPPLRTVRFSDAALTAGVDMHLIDGVTLRVTGVAKTVADCFKFRNKIGLDVALEALREARRSQEGECATICGASPGSPRGECDAALSGGGYMTQNLAASIQARLLNRAKANGEDFNLVLTRYAIERFLNHAGRSASTAPARVSARLGARRPAGHSAAGGRTGGSFVAEPLALARERSASLWH